MMGMTKILFALLILTTGCATKTGDTYLTIPATIVHDVEGTNPEILDSEHIVYYYSGDCSICYGNIAAIARRLPNVPLLIISSSKDTALINYYLDQISYRGDIYLDPDSAFLRSNIERLNNSKIFLVDPSNRILAEAAYLFDEKAFSAFSKKLNN